MTLTPDIKFAFVGGCLAIAVISGVRCWNKKDWLLLVAALMSTVMADYFLVLQEEHLYGVAAFCFAHLCYIFRSVGFRKWMFVALSGFAVVWGLVLFVFESVIFLAGIYAILFAMNIYANAKTRRPKINYYLVMAGLVLFALCDINVFLYSLPLYTGLPNLFPYAYLFIWIFYLPSQFLLAISSVRAEG